MKVQCGSVVFGGPVVLIAGPCVLEEPSRTHRIARALVEMTERVGVPLVFKASFDKANRTSGGSYRGPGLTEGLRQLADIQRTYGVPVTTDVHEPGQAAPVAEVVDLLQVPAFLCRQTDLLTACAATGRPVNVKRGPFLNPASVGALVAKLSAAGDGGVLLTERGTTFGHGDLVVDFRGVVSMQRHAPVIFDGTHSAQRPGAAGDHTVGERAFVRPLVRAALAVGVDGIFAEVHDDPARARSDAATQLPLEAVPALLQDLLTLGRPPLGA